ncbi:LpxI family protein [Ruegeria aquimaris]|uniref:UDP-2,3-diacylglucosamine diphosphatase LpxI n=1 Tax=Ruegeria aquimaris TaxID=2984333 RepID=A0ABT3ADH1_9RHOB|nr:UDP-2,3-diacylglucosamine diphosphatase LpxI [Ruegeria sp. XHP0148]MCV2886718.1 UDP-2,3-diacylglucosamine diphosphatase LpxI [Ruegeria sp. XHP0148]
MLALIAGAGALPDEVAIRLQDRPLVCSMAGFLPDRLKPDVVFRIEHLGSFLADLKARGVTEVCMAGAVGRPVVDPSQIDTATLPLVPVIQQALATGDDGALRAVIGLIEQAGMTVRAAQEIAPDLLLPVGCVTASAPGDQESSDARRGATILRAMAVADVGQACVVHRGQALAIESVFGTDWMLNSLAQRPDAGGGVLYKAPKPGQDRRADLPTIGIDTVTAAVAAGLSGIVIEAGGVIVLDQSRVIAECDRLGLFLMVQERAC